jgi:hypothetical protein
VLFRGSDFPEQAGDIVKRAAKIEKSGGKLKSIKDCFGVECEERGSEGSSGAKPEKSGRAGRGGARVMGGGSGAADGAGAKKRPSVETEGRLTIACHMKKLE